MTTETETELGNVVAFPLADEPDPKSKVNFLLENEGHFCLHPGYTINEHDRQVKCKKCGAVIDHFELLMQIAKKETHLANDVSALRMEEKQRRVNIEKLIQIERNAKARIRKSGFKGDLPHWQLQEAK
ncbi:hypothetical protein [Serratia sp. P2ACOL2]|uniref:hypothetical protein n=1 Tax=Serratia sp. P2ACOL2 TaxID=2482769 RepID=UPI000EFD31AB|nr:hypothetical protein [Serratia sp. P2ACOL2]AYO38483.1 hypothetical protein EBA31_14770 [Serratia sp. P2ACOL2]